MENKTKANATLATCAMLAVGTLPNLTPLANFISNSAGNMILGFLNHGFLAATIGGLADWFAVTALFRKPLGISYRTEILKRNRQRITDAIIEFVGEDLLNTKNIMDTIKEENTARLLIEFFERYQGRQKTKQAVYEIMTEILSRADSESISKAAAPILEDEIKQFDTKKIIDAAVKVVTAEKYSRKILIALFQTGEKILKSQHMQDAIFKKIVELRTTYEGDNASRALVFDTMNLTDEKILSILNENVTEKISSTITALEGKEIVDAEKAATVQNLINLFENAINSLAADLDNDKIQAEFANILSSKVNIANYIQNWLEVNVKGEVAPDFINNLAKNTNFQAHDKIWRSTVDELIDKTIDEFIRSTDLQDKIDSRIKVMIENLLEEQHGQIPNLIRERLNQFSDDELTKFVEGKVADDLQMIRINGSVCGAIVGMLLYIVTVIIG